MLLSELAACLPTVALSANDDAEITGVQADSRLVRQGDLFVCISGGNFDGHTYAAEAVSRGAVALVAERATDAAAPTLLVPDSRRALAELAAAFHRYPSRELGLIGVTGTNGKTTTVFLIDHILRSRDFDVGLLGTIQSRIAGTAMPSANTTMEAHLLQHALRRMVDGGARYCAMEVSSHALQFGRVLGCHYRTAVFTNLTQDHLDFHGTMERYCAAKGLLFARLGNGGEPDPARRRFAVLNRDDEASVYMAAQTAAHIVTYAIESNADVMARDVRFTPAGTSFVLDTFAGSAEVHTRLFGKFNVYNALAAAAAVLVEGVALSDIAAALATAEPVDGRMQAVDAGQAYHVLVDYAHTPDGLDNALRAISEFAEGRIITVFGCGGDRDKGKRPLMGRIAAQYSDYVIVTSDNPRSENPAAIVADVVQGIVDSGIERERYEHIVDRAEAIRAAMAIAARGDVVLIAGKGHETYQILQDRTIDFDDREVARAAIKGGAL